MKTISISQWVAAAKLNRLQQKATKVTKASFPLFASVILFLCAFAASGQVNLNIGTLAPNDKITITFDATINTPFPANTFAVSNQASLTATGVSLNSDDPNTALINDPTITTLSVARVITSCPPSLTTNIAPGTCTRVMAFAATAV